MKSREIALFEAIGDSHDEFIVAVALEVGNDRRAEKLSRDHDIALIVEFLRLVLMEPIFKRFPRNLGFLKKKKKKQRA